VNDPEIDGMIEQVMRQTDKEKIGVLMRNVYTRLRTESYGVPVVYLHSPYATVMWDYVNRGMPLGKEGSLTPDEVYALTAYLLFKNGVIGEEELMDAQSLPKVVMPNRQGFALPAQPWKHGTSRLPNYP